MCEKCEKYRKALERIIALAEMSSQDRLQTYMSIDKQLSIIADTARTAVYVKESK